MSMSTFRSLIAEVNSPFGLRAEVAVPWACLKAEFWVIGRDPVRNHLESDSVSVRKKWGKTATKTERLVREAVPKPETMQEIAEYLKKSKHTTVYDIANRFSVRMSVAKEILRQREADGSLVAYVRDGGFVAYSVPAEIERRASGRSVLIGDALKEVASSAPAERLMTDEMEAALAAAASITTVKPSRLARQRREAGERKEKVHDKRPEVVVEPLEEEREEEIIPPIGEPERARRGPFPEARAGKPEVGPERAPTKKPIEIERPVITAETVGPKREAGAERARPKKKPAAEPVKPAGVEKVEAAEEKPKARKKAEPTGAKPGKAAPKAEAKEEKPRPRKKAESDADKPARPAKKKTE